MQNKRIIPFWYASLDLCGSIGLLSNLNFVCDEFFQQIPDLFSCFLYIVGHSAPQKVQKVTDDGISAYVGDGNDFLLRQTVASVLRTYVVH